MDSGGGRGGAGRGGGGGKGGGREGGGRGAAKAVGTIAEGAEGGWAAACSMDGNAMPL